MPKNVLEYQCLLISPSDVEDERDAITSLVVEWNAQIGEALNARVQVVKWETHSVPDVAAPAQATLNRQIVDRSDFAVAVFWSRLGTPTETHASGSLEEIDRLRKQGVRVLVYFSTADIPQGRLNDGQFEKLRSFKESLRQEGLLGQYRGTANLREQVVLHLTAVVNGLLQRDRTLPSPGEKNGAVLTAPRPDVRVIVDVKVVFPSDGQGKYLRVVVQNHSPTTIFLASLSLSLRSDGGLLLARDAITGRDFIRQPLLSGQSYQISVVGHVLSKHFDDLAYAECVDDIGRSFKSSEESMRKVIADLKVPLRAREPKR